MRNKRILYTAFDGRVAICCPAPEIIRAMGCGGLWVNPSRGFIQRQLESKIGRGARADAALRLCLALAFGGAPTSFAWEIIKDADCGHLGTGHDLVDVSEIPTDRIYRNAWRRSPNGGPIWVDEDVAQKIDEARMWAAYERMAT